MTKKGPAGQKACVAFFLAFAAGGANAYAQPVPSIDARTWQPSVDPKANLVLEPPTTPGPWLYNVGLFAQYARNPVTLYRSNAVLEPVAHAIVADMVAGVGLGDRAEVGVDLPLFLWQKGDEALPGSVVQGGAAPVAGVGDASILGKATIVSNDRNGTQAGWGMAVLGSITVPTGNRASFMSDGALGASARVLAEYASSVGALRAAIGYSARTEDRTWPTSDGVVFGDSVSWAIGAVARPKVFASVLDRDDRQLWEIAAHGALPAGPVAPFGLGGAGASLLSPALVTVDDRVAVGHWRDAYVLFGGEIGLDHAVGVPAFRVILSIGWAPRVHDEDSDGVPDDTDQCPDLPEDRDGIQDADGCPDDDADGDGILDTYDACPLVPGVPASDPRQNGCPVANPGLTPANGVRP